MGNQRMMTSASVSSADRRRVSDSSGGPAAWLANWLTNGPQPQPPAIVRRLVLHSQTKKRTLILAVFATLLMIGITAAITDTAWAYAWFAIEALFGLTRYAALLSLEKAEAGGREGNITTVTLLGLAWAVSFSIGCGLCVTSEEISVIVLAGMVIAGLSGGISSRNAGTPRHGIIMILVLGTPFTWALVFSPIPHLPVVAALVPLYGIGVAFILLENYQVLLHLILSEQENRRLANADPLTGLPNRIMKRRRFDELLSNAAAATDDRGGCFTAFCLDLDGFKAANDRYGHATGDAILVEVAHRLRAAIRDIDLIFRVGGDEFVILLPALDADQAQAVAARIIDAISQPFDVDHQQTLRIGVSIGGACFPRDGQTADELLRSADRAMYQAKRRGKGGFVAYCPTEAAPELVPATDASSQAFRDPRETLAIAPRMQPAL
jgi:diguanylate cyclase (GGDEF)-like protein